MTGPGAALGYAARGWPVLPLRYSQKVPATAHGLKDATTDPEVIQSWWSRWPHANVGLATGVMFDVLDIDSPEALERLFDRAPLSGEAGDICGPTVLTPRGWHVYVAPTGQGNTVRLGGIDGVDWRGRGGYVVAPPSMLFEDPSWITRPKDTGPVAVRAVRWAWEVIKGTEYQGPDTPIRTAPDWLIELLIQRPTDVSYEAIEHDPHPIVPMFNRHRSGYVMAALRGECEEVAAATPGGRNDRLHLAAIKLGTLVGAGMLDEGDATACLAAAAYCCALPDQEARSTIKSGLAWGRAHPREVR